MGGVSSNIIYFRRIKQYALFSLRSGMVPCVCVILIPLNFGDGLVSELSGDIHCGDPRIILYARCRVPGSNFYCYTLPGLSRIHSSINTCYFS